MIISLHKTGPALIKGIIIIVLFEGLISSFLSMISFSIDLINLCLLLICIISRDGLYQSRDTRRINLLFLVYIIYLSSVALINFVSPLLFVWAVRNNIRYFVFFVGCVNVFSEKEYTRMLNFSFPLVLFNLCLVFLQTRIPGLNQDNIGGVFGTTVGGNGGQNVFCSIMVIYYLHLYLNKNTKLVKLIIVIISSLYIAGVAEITALFIEIPVFFVTYIIINKPTVKMGLISVLIVIAMIIGLRMLASLFPHHYVLLKSIGSIIEGANEIGSSYQIPRLGAISFINNLVFKNNPLIRFFGLGLGACEYSEIDLFTSSFYKQYGYLNYRWIDFQMRYLETGYIGLVLYFMLILVIVLQCIRNVRKKRLGRSYYSLLVSTFLLFVVNSIYNSSLRNEHGYLLFFFLAYVPIIMKGDAFSFNSSKSQSHLASIYYS